MINKSNKLLLVLALLFSSQAFAEDVPSSTQPLSTEKAKHKLNTRAIYPNGNISQNSDGEWVYSSKGEGVYKKKWALLYYTDDQKIYYQDEFKVPNIFNLRESHFSAKEMKGSHIPERQLEIIEGYLHRLVEQCETIYNFNDSFHIAPDEQSPFEIRPICNKKDQGLCLNELAPRIQRCVPYYHLKLIPFIKLSEKNNPFRFEYFNFEESYLLLKQYEIIYLTLRANQLMGKYGKLMIPMTLLQEYAKETGFYKYIQEQKLVSLTEFSDASYAEFSRRNYEYYAEIYFKGRKAWQDGFAEFLDKKTTELSILERDYTTDPLDFDQLRDEFKKIYPKRYIPQSRKFNPSWTFTHLQDEMKLSGSRHILSAPLEYLGIYDDLKLYSFTYSEIKETHLSKETRDQAYEQLISLFNQCIEQDELKATKLPFNPKYPHSTGYSQSLYGLLANCTKIVPHYDDILSSLSPLKYSVSYEGKLNLEESSFLPQLEIDKRNQSIIIDRTLLRQDSIIENELYPKIYLVMRHYRLLGSIPITPIPTKLMDEYLEINKVDVNRDSYDDVLQYLFDYQDDFAEFLDNKFNELVKGK